MSSIAAFLGSNKRKIHPFCGGAVTDEDPEKVPSVSLRSALVGMLHRVKSPSQERKSEKIRPWEEDDDREESSDSEMSDLPEAEREFFQDMKRVMRGEVINAARVEIRPKSSFRQVLRGFSRKMKASHVRGGAVSGASETLPEKAERGEKGGALCEKTILLGRRSREKEVSNLGFFLEKAKTQKP